jgi:hypothetical protein
VTDEAVATFSRATSCPVDRITVHPIERAPPPDISSDPGRLAVYQQTHADKAYFILDGCGKSVPFACHRSTSYCSPDLESAMPASVDQLLSDRATQAEVEAAQRTLPPGKRVFGFYMTRDPQGLFIHKTVSGSGAEGKVFPGDIITAAGGAPVTSYADLWAVTRTHLHRPLTLTVLRGGAPVTVVFVPGG